MLSCRIRSFHAAVLCPQVQTCIDFGADVIMHGEHIGDAMQHALAIAGERGMSYINGLVCTPLVLQVNKLFTFFHALCFGYSPGF